MLPPAIFLMGPTAAGKSRLALALSRHLPCEIVSVDSVQVYRGLDIGTAKPSAEQRRQVPHWMLDLRDPAQPYSVEAFRREALTVMAQIVARGRIPLLVGGSMLYFKVLLEGLSAVPAPSESLRRRLRRLKARFGGPRLHRWLAHLDPEAADRIRVNDWVRMERALEVLLLSGKTLLQWHQEHQGQGREGQNQSCSGLAGYQVYQLALAPARRPQLHRQIENRVLQMLKQGLVAEVEGLYQRPDLHLGLPAVRAVGYRQVWEHLAGNVSHDNMVQQMMAASRQLARRQLIWLRGWPGLHWLSQEQPTGEPAQKAPAQKDFAESAESNEGKHGMMLERALSFLEKKGVYA